MKKENITLKRDKNILSLLMTISIVSQFSNITRVIGLGQNNLPFIIMTLTGIYVCYLIITTKSSLSMNYLEALLVVIPILYIPQSYIMNGVTSNFISDIFHSIFFIIFIVYIKRRELYHIENHFIKINKIMILSLAISLLILFSINIGAKIQLAAGKVTVPFILPLCYLLVHKRYKMALLYFFMLVLGNKRAVLIGSLVSFIIYVFIDRYINKKFKKILLVFIILIFSILSYFTFSYENASKLPIIIRPMFNKLVKINIFSSDFNITNDSRINEIKSAIRPIAKEKSLILIGMGHGYEYDIYDYYGNLKFQGIHNVHFSPLSILTKYGLLYTILLYYYICSILIRAIKKYNSFNKIRRILTLYAIGCFIFSFTAFAIYLEYLFTYSLGVISYIDKDNRKY